jgi:hypothetical protein
LSAETDDVVALWRLQSRYADVISRRAWGELGEVFLSDTIVHIDTVSNPPRSLVGPVAFGEFVAGAIEHYDHFQFVILNTVVDLSPPDEASGRIFMCEIRHDPSPDVWHTAYGLYQDRYRRIDDRWWIVSRHYRSLARTGPTQAIFGLPD